METVMSAALIPEYGHFALILAWSLSLVQAALGLWGAWMFQPKLMAVSRSAAIGQFWLVLFAFAILVYAFIINDFSLLYVTENSNSALPVGYRIAAVWGAHEGSLLLWSLIQCVWTILVIRYSKALPVQLSTRVIAILGLISLGFLSFMLFTSNPFERLLPMALDGRDLNPLLQDPALAIHPPMLYMGYVGFSVPFAFAIAALISGRLDAVWARWSRPWTIAAWLFLTIGITLGSWWAYYELGWGGWWFWDPVENASFLPWLAGTALIHSLAVTDKRGAFKSWAVMLAITAFAMSLLGTFLVRSGVLVSVHAFATDPERGGFILAFLGIVIGGSLALFAWRAPQMRSRAKFALYSRESFLLINNILLITLLLTVLLGTLFPLLADAFGYKVSVGEPWFEFWFLPLGLLLLLAAGMGMMVRWKRDKPSRMLGNMIVPLILAAVVAMSFLLTVATSISFLVVIGLLLAGFTLATSLIEPFKHMKNKGIKGVFSLPNWQWGMITAHTGLAVFVLGVILTKTYSVAEDLALKEGATKELGGYSWTFNKLEQIRGPNYTADTAEVMVYQHGELLATLRPEKRIYDVRKDMMTEAAIDPGLTRDLYVSLGENLSEKTWSFRIQFKPFIRWVWGGALLMALGGFFAATDRRYRITKAQPIGEAST